jgi:hypothetical protein
VSITESAVKLNEIERKIYDYCCAMGREMMKKALEEYDEQLRRERDFKMYRNKGVRKTVMKTVMGEVEFRRAVYETRDSNGRKGFVYLLDEAIGRSNSGFFSELLSEEIVCSCCNSSYRNAAREVSELTGQTLSHTAAWNVIQHLGKGVDALERRAAALAVKNEGVGKLATKLLFEEQDGIWLKLQGRDRRQHGTSKEMKLAIAYDGAKKTGKKRYELTNKVACANFESADKFQRRKEGVIAQSYSVDEIETRLLNGDGAQWIKSAVTDETVHFQLDPFHRNKAVRSLVRNEGMRNEIMNLLYQKEIDTLLVYIEACSNSVDDKAERENLLDLLAYFTNNKDGLVPCHRRGLDLPAPPEGTEYRRMGAMESNVFSLVGNRMKGRRACWSVNGGNNLARLLCLKATHKLHDTLQSLSPVVLPIKYVEEITVAMSASKTPKFDGKGYEPHRAGAFPAIPEWKTFRDMGKLSSSFS